METINNLGLSTDSHTILIGNNDGVDFINTKIFYSMGGTGERKKRQIWNSEKPLSIIQNIQRTHKSQQEEINNSVS